MYSAIPLDIDLIIITHLVHQIVKFMITSVVSAKDVQILTPILGEMCVCVCLERCKDLQIELFSILIYTTPFSML